MTKQRTSKKSRSKRATRKIVSRNNRFPGINGGNTTSYFPIMRQPGFPARLLTRLTYTIQKVDNWAATSAVTYRYLATGPFQIDPVSGTGQPTYYDQLAFVYASQRTVKSNVIVEACAGSNGSMPVNLTIVPLNADPGTTPFAGFLAAPTLPYAKSTMVPSYGGGKVRLTNSISVSEMFGSDMVLYDDNFASLVSALPVNNYWWGIVLYNNFTFTATQPFTLKIVIQYDIEFYDRKLVVDT